ncbi:hypothetical protein KIN20_006779 [Parelaphostrongylus tenuis]|uniref:Uncharacterized protein n=1 Tax=Parelaphostrongylus tenuis TaxID=148309 RepID=A0AAD5MKX1_PARTN|nr:hypothetical protein KIN20_006779 [Parelaphostrongylus tenuis]
MTAFQRAKFHSVGHDDAIHCDEGSSATPTSAYAQLAPDAPAEEGTQLDALSSEGTPSTSGTSSSTGTKPAEKKDERSSMLKKEEDEKKEEKKEESGKKEEKKKEV